jgi:hypothetical protein
LQEVVQARVDLGDTTDPTDHDAGAPTKQGARKAQS